MIFWLFGLLLALVVAIFASHNPAVLDVSFFGMVIYRVSLSVVILVSAFLGALISFFFSGIRQLGMGREIKKTKKALDETSKRELQHLEEIKVLQLSREKALIEAERNATGDIRVFRDEIDKKDEEISRLQEAVIKLQEERPVVPVVEPEEQREQVPPEAMVSPEDREAPEEQPISEDKK